MKVTIVYDNTSARDDLEADWGFSALVTAHGRRLLFDTGAKGSILLGNMEKLEIDPRSIEEILISHDHWDHTGGLSDILEINPVPVYIPKSASGPSGLSEVIRVDEAVKIHEGIYSTGELEKIEQSLVVEVDGGVAVIVGCSHSGIGNIIRAAQRFGPVKALIGGYHGFDEFEAVEGIDLLVPTHCTQFKSELKSRYPGAYREGGAGRVFEL